MKRVKRRLAECGMFSTVTRFSRPHWVVGSCLIAMGSVCSPYGHAFMHYISAFPRVPDHMFTLRPRAGPSGGACFVGGRALEISKSPRAQCEVWVSVISLSRKSSPHSGPGATRPRRNWVGTMVATVATYAILYWISHHYCTCSNSTNFQSHPPLPDKI